MPDIKCQHCIVLYGIVLYCTALYCVVLYCMDIILKDMETGKPLLSFGECHIPYPRAFQLQSTAGRTHISQVIRRAARSKFKGVK